MDDTIVPFHVPAMLVANPPDTDVGATGFPAHAETLARTQTTSATRIAFLLCDVEIDGGWGCVIVTVRRIRVKTQNRDWRTNSEIG